MVAMMGTETARERSERAEIGQAFLAEVLRERLTPRQQRFVAEYLIDLNATKAAIRAGYNSRTARQIGYENLTKPYIQAEIERQNKERVARLEIDADDVLRQLKVISDFDIRGLFDETGNLKPPHALTEEQGKAVASYEIINERSGKRQRYKVRLCDKLNALKLLGRHLNLFSERVVHPGEAPLDFTLKLGERISEGRNLAPCHGGPQAKDAC